MCAMTRDELLLTALLRGDASTVELAEAAGRSERAARYGLTHLVKTGLVWSPERGRWRLTDAGHAIATTVPQPVAHETAAPAETHGADEALATIAAPLVATGRPSDAETATSTDDAGSVPGWLWGLGAIVVGGALLYLAARPLSGAAPEPPPVLPGWPYNVPPSWVR